MLRTYCCPIHGLWVTENGGERRRRCPTVDDHFRPSGVHPSDAEPCLAQSTFVTAGMLHSFNHVVGRTILPS